jgi:type I restriction enzyme, S subunit
MKKINSNRPLSVGISHRKAFFSISEDVEYIRAKVQVEGRGIVLRDKVFGSQIVTKQQQIIKKGDFLVAEIDAKMGGFGLVPDELDGGIVSSHYFPFEIDSSVILPGYLRLLCVEGTIKRKIQSSVRGSLNYAAVRPRHILDLEIPMPTLAIQKRLSDMLDQVDYAHGHLEAQKAALQKLPTAILREAFENIS